LEELSEVLDPEPLGSHQKQRSAIVASKHAGKTKLVELDPLEDFATFADAHATLHRRGPYCAVSVEADTVGPVIQSRPHPGGDPVEHGVAQLTPVDLGCVRIRAGRDGLEEGPAAGVRPEPGRDSRREAFGLCQRW